MQYEKQQLHQLTATQAQLVAARKKQEEIVHKLSTSYQSSVQDVYEEVKSQCHNIQSDGASLLLPSVQDAGGQEPAVDTVSASAHLISLEREGDNAIRTAHHYCDLADTLKATNRHLQNKMYDSIDTIQKFWRNNIKKSQTRVGKMVMTSLSNVHHKS